MKKASLPPLRNSISDSAAALGVSRAHLYKRIAEGEIRVQHDGRRAFITTAELQRYVQSK